MVSCFSNKDEIQVQEGKGIQEEEGLIKSSFPSPNAQRFKLQRGVLNTLGHLSLILEGCRTKFSKETLFLTLQGLLDALSLYTHPCRT